MRGAGAAAADASKWQDGNCRAMSDRFRASSSRGRSSHYALPVPSPRLTPPPTSPPSSINGASPNFAIIASIDTGTETTCGDCESQRHFIRGWPGLGSLSASTWGTSPCTATAGQPAPELQAAETTCTNTTSACIAPAWPAGAP